MKLTYKSISIAVAVVFLTAALSFAMPPLHGKFEPSYPAGVNAPADLRLNRDDPDLEGEWNCLIILIDFPDYTWDNQNDSNFFNEDRLYDGDHYRSMLFSEGEYAHPGSASEFTGSMRDFYSEVSGNLFTVTGVATRWYRAPHEYGYYCNQDGEQGTGDDFGFGEFPNNAQGLTTDAIELADDDVDFSQYDNDGDGEVDALFIIHAGPGAEQFGDAGASYIWSHKWSIPENQKDGVSITGYTIEPENGTVGVFCHEFGHALGLPDLYDTDDSSEGIGEWGLMGSGGWCYKPGDPFGTSPSHMCGWSKMRLGWVEVNDIHENTAGLQIRPIETDHQIYRVWQNGEIDAEYFILENRQRIGFDAALVRRQVEYNLPAPSGMLITHIDDRRRNNARDNHRLVDVEEASPIMLGNGEWFEQLDSARHRPDDMSLYNGNRGDNGDLWPGFATVSEDSTNWTGARSRVRFGINTVPSSVAYNDEPSLVEISNMRMDQNIVICDVNVSAPDAPLLTLGNVEVSDGESGNGIVEPGDTLTIVPHLRNIGQRPAVNTSLGLAYVGEYEINVEPAGQVGYPDIEPDGEAASRVAFTLIVPVDIPPNSRVILEGTATCDNQREFPVSFAVTIEPAREWMKYVNNPVLGGTPGFWDAAGIGSIDIIDYADSLVCYYIGLSELGESAVGRAVSQNFGENWIKNPDPVIASVETDWAAGGIFGLAVMETGNGYMMMIGGNDGNETISLGRAVSENGLDWEVSAEPSITSGGWCAGIFPIGQFDLFLYGNIVICSYGGYTRQGYVAMGTATSEDLVNWSVSAQPSVIPTLTPGSFDAYLCFSPDLYTGADGVKLIYSGASDDFVPRIGMINVIDINTFERYEGSETGGSILETDAEGWEANGILSGARLFSTPDGARMLYSVLNDQSAAIGLAIGNEPNSIPADDGLIGISLPRSVTIGTNYPNPFNGTTVIPFHLSRIDAVVIGIYDLSGRSLFVGSLGRLTSGEHRFTWQAGENMATGIYVVRIDTPHGSASSRILFIK